MNAKWNDYTDVNEQSVVLKVEYKENGSVDKLIEEGSLII
jgi:hypothetical protein